MNKILHFTNEMMHIMNEIPDASSRKSLLPLHLEPRVSSADYATIPTSARRLSASAAATTTKTRSYTPLRTKTKLCRRRICLQSPLHSPRCASTRPFARYMPTPTTRQTYPHTSTTSCPCSTPRSTPRSSSGSKTCPSAVFSLPAHCREREKERVRGRRKEKERRRQGSNKQIPKEENKQLLRTSKYNNHCQVTFLLLQFKN